MGEANNTMTHKNEVHVSGLVAKDPIIHNTATGKKVANITLATTFKTKTEYHRCVLWEELAEKAQHLPKGEFVQIVGRLQTRSWEDASKVKHYVTEIVAFQFVVPNQEPVAITPSQDKPDSRPQTGKQVASAILSRPVTAADPITDDDVAF